MPLDNLKTPEEEAIVVANFKNLLEHPGWQILVSIFKEDIKTIKQQILDGLNNNGEKLTIGEIEVLRQVYRQLEVAIKIPEDYIKMLSGIKDEETEPLDPYYTAGEIKKMREKRESVNQ